jgi:UDP-glucuronate 4-epimerase
MELFAHSYHHLWGLPITVFRFFNVYGPHGRPDMMPWQWAQQIHRGAPITLFNGGRLHRDWTYIDDVVDGLEAALDEGLPWEILNLGRGRPVENVDFVHVLEGLLQREAVIVDAPAPASEPRITFADVSRTRELLGYEPKVSVEEGLAHFVEWLRAEGLL